MPRTAKYVPQGVPKGWCARPATAKDRGITSKQVAFLDPKKKSKGRALRTVYKKGSLTIQGRRGATHAITYGCKVGHWKPTGSYKGKRSGKCEPGFMRPVRFMKPKARAEKSKSKAQYKCVPRK